MRGIWAARCMAVNAEGKMRSCAAGRVGAGVRVGSSRSNMKRRGSVASTSGIGAAQAAACLNVQMSSCRRMKGAKGAAID